MLVSCSGNGIAAFMPDTAKPLSEQSVPLLSVCIDQGSVGFSPMHYMLFGLQANCVLISNPSHRSWNDLKHSIKQSSLWECVVASGVAMNVGFGPFEGQAWWHQIVDAGVEYSQVAGPHDPLYEHLLPKIAADRGESDMLLAPEYAEETFQVVVDSRLTQLKGPKLALCCWMSWLDCFKFWRPMRHLRLLLLLYIGLRTVWVTNDPKTLHLSLKIGKGAEGAWGGGTSIVAPRVVCCSSLSAGLLGTMAARQLRLLACS